MPQIIVKGVTEAEVKSLAVDTCKSLGEIVDCPSDWFVFDYIQSGFFDETGEIRHWPVVQVWWFERPQEVQDAVAKLLNDYFVQLGYPGSQISFHIFDYSAYYEEGNHF